VAIPEDVAVETTPATEDISAPTSPSERVEVVDVIRGVALFGILAANIRGFAGPGIVYSRPAVYWPLLHDRVAQAFIDTFIQGKFIAIFAMLFGAGFAAQVERAGGRNGRFAAFFARRMFVLLLIGLAHGLLLWFGDVLLEYASLGFLLLLFVTAKDRTVLRWAAVGYLTPVVALGFAVGIAALLGQHFPARSGPAAAELARLTRVFAHGSWSAIAHERFRELRYNWGMLPAFGPNIFGLFLFGVLAWRRDIFRPSASDIPRYRTVARWALAFGTVVSLTATALRWMYKVGPMVPTPRALLIAILHSVAVPALSTAYVCWIIALFASVRGARLLRPFAAAGRMGLTTYLSQSVIGVLLFQSYGLGLFGRYGPAMLLLATVVIYAVQVAFSVWWIARFRFGPVEWLWRSLTYLRLQPMRARIPAPAVGQASEL
jgi:uncharacterized protein